MRFGDGLDELLASRRRCTSRLPIDDALEERLDALARRAACEGPMRRQRGADRRRELARFVRACRGAWPRLQGDGGAPPRRALERRARLPEPARRGRIFGDEEAALGRVGRRRRSRSTRERSRGGAATRRTLGSWRGSRRELLHSIGSCSFFEPIEELEALADAARVTGGCRVRGLLRRRGRAARRVPRRSRRSRSRCAQARRRLRGAYPQPVPRARARRPGRTPSAVSTSSSAAAPISCRSRTSRSGSPSPSPTTSTSTPRSSTRRTSAACSGRTPSRSFRTGATFRSPTTAGRAPSSSAARRSCARAARRRRLGDEAPRFGPSRPARHRARARLRRRRRQPARGARKRVRVPRPRLRRRARQRLERTRHPGVGVPAARAFPREVVRDLDRGVGDAARAPRGPLRGARCRIPRRCPTSAWRATGHSTSSSRSSSAARSCRARTRAASTGRCRSSSLMRR